MSACANSEPTSCGGVPVPGDAKLNLPGCVPDQLDQFLDRMHRHRRIDRQHHRSGGAERHGVEVLERIVAGVTEQIRIVGDVAAGHQHRVAVRRRLRRAHRADIAAGARHVLDEEILAGLRGKALRDQPREQIGRPARRKTDDHLHRPRRPSVRSGRVRSHAGEARRSQAKCHNQIFFHDPSPPRRLCFSAAYRARAGGCG